MADQNAYVLKVLTGAQAGAEVSIADAEYVLGSGPDDDLHFVDLSLKPGHARLRLENGLIKVAGGAGTLKTQSGISILAGDETWQDIDPLDVITIGTTCFAIGAPSADWSTVHSFLPSNDARKPTNPPPVVTQPKWGAGKIATVLATIVMAFVSAAWLMDNDTANPGRAKTVDDRPEIAIITAAFNAFPFARDIVITQEVDGVIEAAGYVDTPAERRALRNAIDETAIPVRFRVWSQAVIENETQAIVENLQIPVQFSVGSDGVLTLRGDVLDERRVDRLVATITENVAGIAQVNVQVQTANTYLQQIRALLARSELDDSVIARLDGTLIEVNGVVVASKIDNWVGFIQSYARRYADKVALRSFVQLVDENGQIIADPVSAQPGLPVIIGTVDTSSAEAQVANQGGAILDLERLKEGAFGADEVFEGFDSAALNGAPALQQAGAFTSGGSAKTVNLDAEQTAAAAVQQSARDPNFLNRASRPESIRGARVLFNMTKAVLADDIGADVPQSYIDELAALGDVNTTLDQMKYLWGRTTGGQTAQDAYLHMLATSPATDFTECWDNSITAFGNLPYTLFWLDYLSVSDAADVSVINPEAQVLLLEAALNPNRLAACAARLSEQQDIDLSALSLYLQESRLNPDFIRFIVRQLNTYPFALSGINMAFQNRYAQTINGTRYNEGGSPEPSSLLINVGELGLLVKEKDRLLVTIYDASLHWKSGG